MNATVKENIVFGQAFKPKGYNMFIFLYTVLVGVFSNKV